MSVSYKNPALAGSGATADLRAKCLVGSAVVVDENPAVWTTISEVAPGSHLVRQADNFATSLFLTGRLEATPSVCEISILIHATDKDDVHVEACARLHHAPAPGRCPSGTFPSTSP
jgi:hypothetical protein